MNSVEKQVQYGARIMVIDISWAVRTKVTNDLRDVGCDLQGVRFLRNTLNENDRARDRMVFKLRAIIRQQVWEKISEKH